MIQNEANMCMILSVPDIFRCCSNSVSVGNKLFLELLLKLHLSVLTDMQGFYFLLNRHPISLRSGQEEKLYQQRTLSLNKKNTIKKKIPKKEEKKPNCETKKN